MKNNNALIIGIMLILFMVFQTLNNYHQRRILNEIRTYYIEKEEILLQRIDSVSNQIKESQKQTDSLIRVTKSKQTKIYNNYYEREKDYIDSDTVNDSIIEYLSRRKFKRFNFQ